MVAVDFQMMKKLLPHVIRARNPIMIRGKHGLGKSELVYGLAPIVAKILGKDENFIYPIVERRASQMPDAGDIMGLPKMNGEVTEFSPMAWFYRCCTEPVILFLDEVDRANQDVRQSLFELGDSRKIAGRKLHEDTIIIACCNSGSGENAYQVGEMDPAELSRWTVFDVQPTVEDWLVYAKDTHLPQVWDFIKQTPSFLEHKGQFEPNKVYPSRRSWTRLNNCLAKANLLEEDNVPLEIYHLADAYVGSEAAISFLEFVKNFEKQVSIEDILVHGKIKVLEGMEVNQYIALIDKLADHELSKVKMPDVQLENLCKFMFAIPAELAMKLWEVVTQACPDNGIAMHQVVIGTRSVADYFAEINGAV